MMANIVRFFGLILPMINTLVHTTDQEKFIPDSKDMERCALNPLECDVSSNYPVDLIDRLISENKIDKKLFTVEPLYKPNLIFNKLDSGEIDDEIKFDQFCKVARTVIFPKMGLNQKNFPRFIVQHEEKNFTQGIRAETCFLKDDEYNLCEELKSHQESYSDAECVQRFSFKSMVILQANGKDTMTDLIQIPSCCTCMFQDRVES